MKVGGARRSRLLPSGFLLALMIECLCGCNVLHRGVDRALMRPQPETVVPSDPAQAYTVGCPDILEVRIQGRPDLSGQKPIGPDGRIDMGLEGRLRIEGRTVDQAGKLIALSLNMPGERVDVRVAEFRSKHIYLSGQVEGFQRAVPYQGPETICELLHRVGGITRGAALNEVYVVRPHLAEDRPPEVFNVRLRAILLHEDEQTNVRLQPFDQIYVGANKRFDFSKVIPPWLRPVYEALVGIRKPSGVEWAD